MKYKFMTQPLASGLYEPEGIYLSTPFDGSQLIIQFWGQHPEYYAQYRYNGVSLKGHIGIDFALDPGTPLFAVDTGRVMEISNEVGGFGRYIKVEHRWGESFLANIGSVTVEAGQLIKRNEPLAIAGGKGNGRQPHLHFAIRIAPFNRFDGWGGFSDPLPYLNPSNILFYEEEDAQENPFEPHPMVAEKPGLRRP
jgi:murein DD-endopeptidase MepM/ murein hydrolase activator NlpD